MRPTLPKWKSHKEVEASKIKSIRFLDGMLKYELTLECDAIILVDEKFVARGLPEEGCYYVRYEDGYESWSPADAFEAGYTPLNLTLEDFSERILKPVAEGVSKDLAEELGYTPQLLTQMEVPAMTNGDILRRARELILGSDAMMQPDARYTASELMRLLDAHFCFAKAGVTEPIFTLRAQDRLSAKLVYTWAKRAKNRRAKKSKVRSARLIAEGMKLFPGRRYPT